MLTDDEKAFDKNPTSTHDKKKLPAYCKQRGEHFQPDKHHLQKTLHLLLTDWALFPKAKEQKAHRSMKQYSGSRNRYTKIYSTDF